MPVLPATPSWRFDDGGTVITGTDLTSGRWRGLQALTTCNLDAGTVSPDLNGTLTGLQIPAGTTVHAVFTAVKLTSGTAIAYR